MAGSYGGKISLDPPVARLVAESSSLTHPSHRKTVLSHHVTHAVALTLPQSTLPAALTAAAPTSDVFYSVNVTVGELLAPAFRALFQDGCVVGIALGQCVDTETTVAVLPSGILYLSVDRDTYHALGLQGRPSLTDPKQRFVVTIDLTDPDLTPESKRLCRLQWCLTDRLGLRFRFLLAWVPEGAAGSTECPTLADLGSRAVATTCTSDGRAYSHVAVPLLEEAITHALSDDELVDFSEWLGAISCHLDIDGSPETYHSTMVCPEPSTVVPALITQRWQGLVTPHRVAALVAAASSVVSSGLVPWVAVTVWGFQDTPVSWGSREHGFLEGGENHTVYVVGSHERYLRFTSLDPSDACP
eukprot:m.207342 g.207342  ORF g.207342 m.207342 type:complete len:358 (-) comp23693_c0_seq1:35-1108(-)